jgi:hypothetical protein
MNVDSCQVMSYFRNLNYDGNYYIPQDNGKCS